MNRDQQPKSVGKCEWRTWGASCHDRRVWSRNTFELRPLESRVSRAPPRRAITRRAIPIRLGTIAPTPRTQRSAAPARNCRSPPHNRTPRRTTAHRAAPRDASPRAIPSPQVSYVARRVALPRTAYTILASCRNFSPGLALCRVCCIIPSVHICIER